MVELVYAADLKSATFGFVGSSPTTRTKVYAPIVQLDRTAVFYTACRGFESLQTHQIATVAQLVEQEPLHGEGPNKLEGKPSRWFESIQLHQRVVPTSLLLNPYELAAQIVRGG